MPQLFEHCNTGDYYAEEASQGQTLAMTFTPQVTHRIDFLKMKVCKLSGGSPVIPAYIAIRPTDGVKPVMPDLILLEAFDVELLTLPNPPFVVGEWLLVPMPQEVIVEAGNRYGIVALCPEGGNGNPALGWSATRTYAPYAGGQACFSYGEGLSWETDEERGYTIDLMFEEWGTPIEEVEEKKCWPWWWLLVAGAAGYGVRYLEKERVRK